MAWVLWTAVMLGESAPASLGAELIDLEGRKAAIWKVDDGPAVVMVVRARRLRGLKTWETHLRERFEGLSYVRVADLSGETGATYEDVAAKLRERVPEGVRVFVDVERLWERELHLDTSRPNLLLLDEAGNLTATFQGSFDATLFEQVCDAIDQLLESPR
jgi:hypothetical protein